LADREGRRYFDFIDRRLQWLPITQSVTVALTESACCGMRAG
jgi:hypothetical protein